MTAQRPDRVRYCGVEHDLVAVAGMGLFDPLDHDVELRATTTANWRGYQAVYSVRRGQLVLARLEDVGIRAFYDGTPVEELPRIGGVAPVDTGGSLEYEQLNLKMRFTGGLLIGRGFIRALYVHMGFAPAWKYEEVHELVFDAGKLTEEHDRSADAANFRADILSGVRANPDDRSDLLDWIKSTFVLDYGRSLG